MKKSKHPLVLRLCAVWMAALVAVGCTPADKKPQQPAVSVTLTEERPMPIPNQQGRGEPIEALVPQYAEEYLADPLLKESVIAFRRWEWNKVYSQLDTVVTEHPEHLDAYRLQAEVYLINQNYEAALSQLDQILRQDITDLHALGVSSIVMHLLGDTEGEAERLDALMQLSPEAARAVTEMLDQADTLLHTEYTSQPRTEVIPDAIAVYGQTPKKNGTPLPGCSAAWSGHWKWLISIRTQSSSSAAAMCAPPLQRLLLCSSGCWSRGSRQSVSFWTRMQGTPAAMRSAP